MGNLNPLCLWPSCSCNTEKGEPCRFENPDYYINKASARTIPSKAEYYERESAFKFMAEVAEELQRARGLFPSSYNSTIGLMEEVGELAQALLKVEAGKWPVERIRQEAIQVCVMAIRVALEGDASIKSEGANKDNM